MPWFYITHGSHRQLPVIGTNQWKFPPDTYILCHLCQWCRMCSVPHGKIAQTIEIHLAGYIRFQKYRYLLLIVTVNTYRNTITNRFGCLYHIIFTDAQPPGLHRFVVRLHHHRHVPPFITGISNFRITTHHAKCQFRQGVQYRLIWSTETGFYQSLWYGVQFKTVYPHKDIRKLLPYRITKYSL